MEELSLKYQNNTDNTDTSRNQLKTNVNTDSAGFLDIYTSDLPSIYPVRHKYGCSCLYTGDLPPYPRLIVLNIMIIMNVLFINNRKV